MLVQFILNEAFALFKKFGLATFVSLSFLNFLAIAALDSSILLKMSVRNLAKSPQLEIFFNPDTGLDEVQFIANQLQKFSWINQVDIKRPNEALTLEDRTTPNELVELLKDLSPSIQIKTQNISQDELTNFLIETKKLPQIDEIIYNKDGQNILIEIWTLLSKISIAIIIGVILIASIISLLVTHLMTTGKGPDIQVLKSLGASPLLIASPMILFLFIAQPLSFFSSYIVYNLIANHLGTQIQQVTWLSSILAESQSIQTHELLLLWFVLLFIFVLIGSFKVLKLIKANRFITVLFCFTICTNSSFGKQDLPLSNLIYKKQAIENELDLIEAHLQKLQERINGINKDNTRIKKTIAHLSHEYRKIKSKLVHLWLSDLSSWAALKSQAKNASNIIALVQRETDQLLSNNLALRMNQNELIKRQRRLKKLHSSLAQSLDLKEDEYESYRLKMTARLHELRQALVQFDVFGSKNKVNKTLFSPVFGRVALAQFDKTLGYILIIEESPESYLIFSKIESPYVKTGDFIEPGQRLSINRNTNPKLQIRIFDQVIPTQKLLPRGT